MGRKPTWTGRAAVLAHALRLRGARPVLIACDRWLEACEEGSLMDTTPAQFAADGPRSTACGNCFGSVDPLFKATGLPYRRLSEFESAESRERASRLLAETSSDELYELSYRGLDLGRLIESAVFRYFMRTTRPSADDPLVAGVLRRYALASILFVDAFHDALTEISPAAVVTQHGGYISRGVPTLVGESLGIAVYPFYGGQHLGSVTLGVGGPMLREISERTKGPWADLELTPERSARLDEWLRGRQRASTDDMFWRRQRESTPEALARELELDLGRPIVTAYPGVGWDSRDMVMNPRYRMEDAVFDLIELAADRPELQLVVRIHPGEVLQPASEPWLTALGARFPELPRNVRVIPPDSPVSSYELGKLSRAVFVYASTIGLELACIGRRVICAGFAPYRGKGISADVSTRAELGAQLDALDRPMINESARIAAARRFAYYFWFMRCLPFEFWYKQVERWTGARPWWHEFRSLADLTPGRHAGLDILCDAVLSGKEPYLASA